MSVQLLPTTSAGSAMGLEQPQRAKGKKGHLNQIDLIRVLTFASVIAVHDISFTTDANGVTPNALLTILHFTRSTFFFLTGFVLVYTYRERKLVAGNFIKRRLSLIGIPYLAWTLLYFGLQQVDGQWMSVPQAVDTLWDQLIKGTAWYHLYFLLVSIQFYLLFPLVLAFLRATRRHHVKILIVSAALQVATTMALTYLPDQGSDPIIGPLWNNANSFILSYQFYLVAGCLAAFHYEQFHAWISSHTRLIIGLFVGTLVFSEVWYFAFVAVGTVAWKATGVMQPEMILWYSAVILAMYAVGIAWSRRKADGAMHRLVRAASTRSFGVFLVHPAMLWFFLWVNHGWFPAHLSGVWFSLASYCFAIAASLVFVEIVIRSPLSRILVGRERIPLWKKSAPAIAVTQPA